MWVKKDDFEKLRRRVDELEMAQSSVRAPYGARIGKVADLIMEHIGIRIHRSLEHDYVKSDAAPSAERKE